MVNKRFHVEGTSAEIIDFLKTVALSDREAEKTSNAGKWFLGLVIFGGLATLFFAIFQQADIPSGIWWGFAALVLVGLGLSLYGSAGDVDNDRYEALHRLHRFLSHDCRPGSRFSYSMDLRPLDHRAFYKGLGPGWGLFTWVSRFECPLVEARVRLRDGTQVVLHYVCRVRKTSRTRLKWTSRGKLKLKTKTKFKYLDDTEIRVKLPAGAAPPPDHVVEPARMSRLYMSVGPLPTYAVDGQWIKTRLTERDTSKGVKSDTLLWLLAWTFRQLQPKSSLAS